MKRTSENPLVSVIVTTYNRKDLLKETIDSILAQTFSDFELIVVDNYSDYNFVEFMGSFHDGRIRAIQNSNGGIIAINRNIGIREAKGEYIAFCDDDDLWEKGKLETQLKGFDRDDIIAVGCKGNLIGYLDYHRKKQEDNSLLTGLLTFKEIIAGNSAPLSSLIVKNKKKSLFFHENYDFLTVEDFLFQLNLTEHGYRINVLKEPLILYRVHMENGSSSVKKAKNIFNVLNIYRDTLGEDQFLKLTKMYSFGIGLKMLRVGEYGAWKYFRKAFSFNGTRLMLYSFVMLIVSFLPVFLSKGVLKLFYANR